METTTITVIVMLIGLYVFLESFTAINEMQQIRLRDFWRDLYNQYSMKYLLLGFYGLAVIYFSAHISLWHLCLTLPAVLCVAGRTKYRIIHSWIPAFECAITRYKYNRATHKSHADSHR